MQWNTTSELERLKEHKRWLGLMRYSSLRYAFVVAAFPAAVALSGMVGAAEQYPTRPIRMVVSFPPGGGVDTLARIIAPALTEDLGKQVVIDNRPGSGGLIGNRIAAQARPDGYTLLLQGIPFVVAPQISSSTGYDPERDFVPVVLAATTAIVLVVHPSVPAKTLNEFVAHAKGRAGRLNMASGGSGATAHLAAEVFKLSTGAPFTHVPYKGMGPAVTDVIAGHVDAIFATLPSALPHVGAGRLRALAVISTTRSQFATELPTAVESGYKRLVVDNWYGFLAPHGTPPEVVRRFAHAVTRAIERSGVNERLAKAGLEPGIAGPDEFARFMSAEVARWSQVVKASGMRVD